MNRIPIIGEVLAHKNLPGESFVVVMIDEESGHLGVVSSKSVDKLIDNIKNRDWATWVWQIHGDSTCDDTICEGIVCQTNECDHVDVVSLDNISIVGFHSVVYNIELERIRTAHAGKKAKIYLEKLEDYVKVHIQDVYHGDII